MRGKVRPRGQSVNAESGLPQSAVLWGFEPCKGMFLSVIPSVYLLHASGLVLELQPHKVPQSCVGPSGNHFFAALDEKL